MWIVLAPELKLDRPENMIIFLHFSRMDDSIYQHFILHFCCLIYKILLSNTIYLRKLLYFNIDSYSSLSVNMRYQDLFSCFPYRTIILILLFLYSLQIFQSDIRSKSSSLASITHFMIAPLQITYCYLYFMYLLLTGSIN